MRRNLYNKVVEDFTKALSLLGWREVTIEKEASVERQFRRNSYHLILKKGGLGYYCLLHKDRFLYGRIHARPLSKGKELEIAYRRIIAEYKRLRT